MSIKGRNSVANLQKTMIYNAKVDLVSDNVYTEFGLNRSICFQDIEQNSILTSIKGSKLQICRNSNSSKLSCMSSLPARMRLIKSKMKELECSQDFSHYKSTGVFPDAQGQLTQQSLVRSGRISNSFEILWMSSLPASMKKIRSKTRNWLQARLTVYPLQCAYQNPVNLSKIIFSALNFFMHIFNMSVTCLPSIKKIH